MLIDLWLYLAKHISQCKTTMLPCPQLKDRVFQSHKSVHLAAPMQIQRGKYKPWTESQMDRELQSVIAEDASIRKAALEYNVPRSSLAD